MIFKTNDIKYLEPLYDFYNCVIDHQKYDDYSPMWTRDVYPAKDDLKNHLQNDCFYIAEDEGNIIGSLCLVKGQEEMYRNAKWSLDCIDDEVLILHLLAIHPDHRHKGLAKQLLNIVIEDNNDFKAIRLDVVKGNKAASDLYQSIGFKYIGEHEVHYEDTGDITVDFFEKVI